MREDEVTSVDLERREQIIREDINSALAQLPQNTDALADRLLSLDCRGRVGESSNPIVNYLKLRIPHLEVHASADRIRFQVFGGGGLDKWADVVPPHAVSSFLIAFTRSDYPKLMASHDGAVHAEAIAEAIIRQIPALRRIKDLRESISRISSGQAEIVFELDSLVPAEEVEKSYVLYVLKELDGNKTRAAETLGFDPSTLYRKLNKWGAS